MRASFRRRRPEKRPLTTRHPILQAWHPDQLPDCWPMSRGAHLQRHSLPAERQFVAFTSTGRVWWNLNKNAVRVFEWC